ncbi:NAD-dependent succinate-semialdehyde dehydrogenase [Motilibacter deserti]|uniref:NAD-dependent succinate-semialdehyde dehydrogenase n=1 Tax=Motilibacter deserti TaxID=2714956 RepID=A0ABX0GSV0_9ACTN|nr:NAD-dependent succinate-semialdehyde dehydrogenase [Motilibacter deserti]NHC12840.1 NAD-dependent succinate-semialdehyde dehydrogenase [Motilibacter deserti]
MTVLDWGKLPTDLLIGGVWRPAASGRRLDVVDPSTGSPITSVADADVDEAVAAVDAAAAAADDWAATSPRARAEVLRRAFDLMTERREELAQLISSENGKSLVDARGEVAYAAEFFRWYAEEAVRVRGEVALAPAGTNRILVDYEPIGVCVLVTPWNFPAAMATRKIGPALAAGCTVVLKPAGETPLTALALAELLGEAGVPAGVVNVVTTSKAGRAVAAMLADERVRMVSFTGSTEVGRILLREAASRVLKTAMELGGNAPFVVFDDADLDEALDGAMVAKMRNGGQACTAANRFYVQSRLYDAFVTGLTERMAAVALGPGTDERTQCGPLVNQESVDKADRLVRDAVARGARVTTGGQPLDRPGFFYPPTVVADVPADAEILQEEVFAPVAPVVRFDDPDEVLTAANDTIHGLVSYVYTRDLARGLRVARRLESGMVGLNRGLVSDPAAPFGGVKQSGVGREGGHEGLLEYMEAKYVATSW